MGNSSYPKAALKTAIVTGDLEKLRDILTEWETRHQGVNSMYSGSCTDCNSLSLATCGAPGGTELSKRAKIIWLLSQPLNKRGDSALSLAIRNRQSHVVTYLIDTGVPINSVNRDNETPLDVLLGKMLPGEGDILHHHFCPYSGACESHFDLTDEVKKLIKLGAKGPSLHKLVLHVMKDEAKLKAISEFIPDLLSDDNYRISGLMLQVAIWFDRINLVIELLEKGLDPENFWSAPFIPTIVPNTEYRRTVNAWEDLSSDTEGEYIVSCPEKVTGIHSSAGLQSLKLSFVQDWRADWYDGENPEAQFRAGLVLTVDGAIIMIKSANCMSTLEHVVHDIMRFLPPMCGGPDLKTSPLIPFLLLAGYEFTEKEILHLQLKFKMNFSQFIQYTKRPYTLKHLSRLCVRSHLSSNIFHSVPKLRCLPVELRNYLFLDDVV